MSNFSLYKVESEIGTIFCFVFWYVIWVYLMSCLLYTTSMFIVYSFSLPIYIYVNYVYVPPPFSFYSFSREFSFDFHVLGLVDSGRNAC